MASALDLKGKVVAVTGGAGGIGFATVELLLRQGAKVSIADNSEEALEAAEAKLAEWNDESEILTAVVDVRDSAQVDDWIQKTVEKFGERLDGAVNLAGVIPPNNNQSRVENMLNEDWQFVMDINVTGSMPNPGLYGRR